MLERSSTKWLEMSIPRSNRALQSSHLLLLVRLLLWPALYLDRIIDFFHWMINLYYCSRSSDPVSCARIKGRIKSVPLSSAESSAASLQARVSASQIAFRIWSFVIKHEWLSTCRFCLLTFQDGNEVQRFIPSHYKFISHLTRQTSPRDQHPHTDRKRGSYKPYHLEKSQEISHLSPNISIA